MAIGNIIYSTSSSTITSGDEINASDFERSTNLQIDDVSGNLIISGGVNTGSSSNIGSINNLKISGGSDLLAPAAITDGSGNLSWANSQIASYGFGQGSGFTTRTFLSGNNLSYKKIVAQVQLAADTASGTYSITFQTSAGTISTGYNGNYFDIYKTSAGTSPTRNVQNWSGSSAILGRKIGYSLLKIELILVNASTNLWNIQSRNVSYTGASPPVLYSAATGFVTLNNPLLNFTLTASSGTFAYDYIGYIWE